MKYPVGTIVSYAEQGKDIRARVCGEYDEGDGTVLQVYIESINGKPAHGQSSIHYTKATPHTFQPHKANA
jgi:hypothetical protein